MKKIVILGSSPAGVQIIEDIRKNDFSGEITLIAFDDHYPYKRDTFASFIRKAISPENVFCRAKDFYVQNKVNIVLDKKISRINVKRKKIFIEDNGQMDYDILIITDTPENRFPSIKGAHKTGIYGYKKLKDVDQMLNILPVVDTVAIQSDSFSGLQAAAAFANRGKEIIFISSKDSFLTKHFEGDVLQWLVNRLDAAGLRIMLDNAITEILGEKDARAVRLKSGKVFSAQIILFGETDEDLRVFPDSGLHRTKRIEVDAQFRSNIDSIFVVDQVCVFKDSEYSSSSNTQIISEPITPLSILLNQGKVVAAAINGQKMSFEIPILQWDLNCEDLTLTVLGQTGLSAEGEVQRTFEQESGRYAGLYYENNCLVGAVLVNAEDQRAQMLKMIKEKTPIDEANEACLTEGINTKQGNSKEINSDDISTELIDN